MRWQKPTIGRWDTPRSLPRCRGDLCSTKLPRKSLGGMLCTRSNRGRRHSRRWGSSYTRSQPSLSCGKHLLLKSEKSGKDLLAGGTRGSASGGGCSTGSIRGCGSGGGDVRGDSGGATTTTAVPSGPCVWIVICVDDGVGACDNGVVRQGLFNLSSAGKVEVVATAVRFYTRRITHGRRSRHQRCFVV